MLNKNFTCCFTGHRKISAANQLLLRGKIRAAVLSLIEKGYTDFVAGGALGFDTIAAEVVLSLKEDHPEIKLIVVAPYADQALEWDLNSQVTYFRISESADQYICLSPQYTDDCMKKRNRYMVDNSSACIAYCGRNSGGTAYQFAKQNISGTPYDAFRQYVDYQDLDTYLKMGN